MKQLYENRNMTIFRADIENIHPLSQRDIEIQQIL